MVDGRLTPPPLIGIHPAHEHTRHTQNTNTNSAPHTRTFTEHILHSTPITPAIIAALICCMPRCHGTSSHLKEAVERKNASLKNVRRIECKLKQHAAQDAVISEPLELG